MHAPQIIWLILTVFALGISLAKHGEPQGDYNFWSSLIGVAIAAVLLFWGGFFG